MANTTKETIILNLFTISPPSLLLVYLCWATMNHFCKPHLPCSLLVYHILIEMMRQSGIYDY